MTTIARVQTTDSCHYYHKNGDPCYEVERADGKGMRPTTIADARKLNLLPSVTTVLKSLHKEALVQWRCEQTALAVLTAVRLTGETLDEFVYRVLHTQKDQDQEAAAARDKGTEIHAAMESYFSGGQIPDGMSKYVEDAIKAIDKSRPVQAVESVVVGDGYAGKVDLIQNCGHEYRIWDFKSCKTLPTKSYPEHRLQLSAYAMAFRSIVPIVVGNVYISTTSPGEFLVCEHNSWRATFDNGFAPLVQYWQWQNDYQP